MINRRWEGGLKSMHSDGPQLRGGGYLGDDWAKFPTFASHCNSPAKLLGHDLHRGHRAHTLSANNKGEIICRCMWYIAA
jgi:hypothetical protein